jgi:streptomycin 6-kinase
MTSDLANSLPASFKARIIELYGDRGMGWLKHLPALIEYAESHWSIKVMQPFEGLSYNYVAPAIKSDGSELVLKIGVPNPELMTEIDALRIIDGDGMVRLIDSDPDQGMLLLERLMPGTSLDTLRDDQTATSIAGQIMRRIKKPIPEAHSFPTVADWVKGFQRLRAEFDGSTGPFPEELVDLAENLAKDFISSMQNLVLLHGDLHHANILSAEREPWLALDPKGVIGEAEVEVGAFLRNPMPDIVENPQVGKILDRRLNQFSAELGFDRGRLVGWGLVLAVLSAWWSYEDHGHGWEPSLFIAELLEAQQRS